MERGEEGWREREIEYVQAVWGVCGLLKPKGPHLVAHIKAIAPNSSQTVLSTRVKLFKYMTL